MRIRTRIFLGMLIVIIVGFSLLLYWVTEDLEPQYRKATEEPLVDSARILASVAAGTASGGRLNVELFRTIFKDVYEQSFSAPIYDFVKKNVDFRVYITDRSGRVLFDSYDKNNEGRDLSQWLDVMRTLNGEYGARTSRDREDDPSTSVMYVSAPIMIDGRLAGVLSVGKPAAAATEFAKKSRMNIILGGGTVFFSVILVGMLIAGRLTRPINQLTLYARNIRDGKRVMLPTLDRSEVGELGNAFDEMRDALEGKSYIEKYVQALTHEIKSPLSAVRGAAELLNEDMEPGQRARFLSNIVSETDRIGTIVEKLLLLSSLESRKGIQQAERIVMSEVVREIRESMLPLLKRKRISLDVKGDLSCSFEGDRFLVHHAVANLLQNATDFSADGGTIDVTISCPNRDSVELTIRDHGTGIPDYAAERIFERFYSLKRPDTGKKSSGLGLSLVKEVAQLHFGSVTLTNAAGGGAIATLSLPLSHD